MMSSRGRISIFDIHFNLKAFSVCCVKRPKLLTGSRRSSNLHAATLSNVEMRPQRRFHSQGVPAGKALCTGNVCEGHL